MYAQLKATTHVIKRLTIIGVSAVTILLSLTPLQQAAALEPKQEQFFEQAAAEFGVPNKLLLAISYNETRWQPTDDTPSADGGFGPMHLSAPQPPEDGRGDPARPMRKRISGRAYTLPAAASLLHISAETLKKDDQQNVRGGAALLAAYAKEANHGVLPVSIDGWHDAVARYSGAVSNEGKQRFADDIYARLANGSPTTTVQGGTMQLKGTAGLEHKGNKKESSNGTQCPPTIMCRFVPAAYAQNSSDPADYGNYDHANRPTDMKINYIVIHDTEGSYQSAIDHFQDTTSYVSCHYVIRSSDGEVTQMVKNEDVSWCAGDWYVNMHSINIEHEGVATQGAVWYTEAMYQSSAKLVRYLAKKYDIPLDRAHIIGHDNIPTISPSRMSTQHWDPGPYWDWNHYMALLHGVSDQQERAQMTKDRGTEKTVTILPTFAINQQTFQDCSSGTCVTLPAQGSSAVLLHTQPDAASPLLADPYLHTAGNPGTNHIEDWGSKATTGQRFVVAERQGDWTAIWYGGTKGWFYNPDSQLVARTSKSSTVTPNAGKTTIPVYGAAYPEASAYPAGVPVQVLTQLYDMPAGQSYVTTAEKLQTNYFYDATINYSLPHDHEIISGSEKYLQITYNHRIAYVKASDVAVSK